MHKMQKLQRQTNNDLIKKSSDLDNVTANAPIREGGYKKKRRQKVVGELCM
jgi:hypothetical protein